MMSECPRCKVQRSFTALFACACCGEPMQAAAESDEAWSGRQAKERATRLEARKASEERVHGLESPLVKLDRVWGS